MSICCLEATQGGAPERREEVSDHMSLYYTEGPAKSSLFIWVFWQAH